jgi:hypothetical protein
MQIVLKDINNSSNGEAIARLRNGHRRRYSSRPSNQDALDRDRRLRDIEICERWRLSSRCWLVDTTNGRNVRDSINACITCAI